MSPNLKPLSRSLKLPKTSSFFLFGPRQTGKSTLIEESFSAEDSLYFNLLNLEELVHSELSLPNILNFIFLILVL